MPLELPFFPPSLPDESLISRVSRYHLMSSNRTDESTFLELFGRKGFALGAVVPPHIDILASRLPGQPQENIDILIRENTLFPVFRPFLGRPVKSLPPTTRGSGDTEISHMPRHVVGMSGDAKLCLSCASEDEKLHGVGYWRRSHQIPGVTVCWKHKELLLSSCPNCRFPFQHINKLLSAPWNACRCGERLPSVSESKTVDPLDVAYANYAHDLFQEHMAPVNPEFLMNAYREKIKQRGFARGSLPDLKNFQEALIQDLGEPFIRKVDPAFSAKRAQYWLRLSYIESALDLPITRHLLLGMHLFGTANRFNLAVESQLSCGAAPARKSLKKSESNQNLQRDEFRRKITAELKKNPAITMERLWKRRPGAVAWLYDNDKTWLNNTMSLHAKSDVAARPSQAKTEDALDRDYARMAEDISRKLFELPGKPRRVTKGKILAGLPKTIKSTGINRKRFPVLFATVDLCNETAWCFSARKILWAMGELDRFEENVNVGNIVLRSAVISTAVEEILQFCEWDGEKLSKSKIDTKHLLAKAGITRAWRGPSDSKLGTLAGRGYIRKKANL